MQQPKVSCVMLTCGREKMAARALRCFEARSYENAELVIYDTGCSEQAHSILHLSANITVYQRAWHREQSIGELRNLANSCANGEVIAHHDSDDWTHCNRLAEQVALLQSSGADCVGYREVLFWRDMDVTESVPAPAGITATVTRYKTGAWIYSNRDPRYCIGSSLCYWRAAWERRPFKDLPRPGHVTGEDHEFLQGVNSVGETSICIDGPRLICSIHGGNTSGQYANIQESDTWRRAPEWDAYCRERMKL